MTIEEVLKEAREIIQDYVHDYGPHDKDSGVQYVLNQLNQAIADLEKQEPVAWWNGNSKFATPKAKDWDKRTGGTTAFGCDIPLYTSPKVEQEPVLAGVANIDDMDNWYFLPLMETAKLPAGTKFYTSPPQRQWVGLTPQERDEINEQVYGAVPHYVAFHHAIEAKLKEKNT